MKKEKKELIKKFKVVVEDLMDNYELYTDDEKAKIKDVFQKVAELNKVLDKYDFEDTDPDRKVSWEEYLAVYTQFFPPMGL